MRIAFVIVKLKIFQSFAYQFSIHEVALFGGIKGPYSPKYDPILPKFSPEVIL